MPKPDKREIKPLFVRLSETERRRIRTLAVSQGLTMRQAIMQAFEAWAKQLRSGAPSDRKQHTSGAAEKLTAGAQSKGRRQPEHASAGQQVRRPVDVTPSNVGPALADGGPLPGLEALTGDWPNRAAQLDWSMCPAAESVQTKRGTIWVAAGTLVPLVDVFEAVAGGNPLAEIVEVYDLTLQQVTTLLQFAAAGLGRAASAH
jgi:hypothetical protein